MTPKFGAECVYMCARFNNYFYDGSLITVPHYNRFSYVMSGSTIKLQLGLLRTRKPEARQSEKT